MHSYLFFAKYSTGTWSTTTSFTTARSTHTSVAYNGYVYVISGRDSGANTYNDIQYLPLLTTANTARYERTIDTGSLNGLTSFAITGSTLCNYTVSFATAGSDNIYGSTTTVYNVSSGSNIPINAQTTRYLRLAVTMDDSTCGGTSSITEVTLTYNARPDTPTLSQPANSATGVSTNPIFRLGTTDTESDYLRYKIEICSDAACNNIIRTIDQTSSQTGWLDQNQQTNTAYASNSSTIIEYAQHRYQSSTLIPGTYYWRGYAIDPGGSNTWSSASEAFSFTTQLGGEIMIYGGSTIYGGTKVN